MKADRKTVMALALLGLWGLLLLYRFTTSQEPRRAPLKYTKGVPARSARLPDGQAGGPAQRASDADLHVRLELMRERPTVSPIALKNIFAPLPPRNPPPVAPPPPSPLPVGPTPEDLARQEMGQFKYLGYLKKNDRERAFFSRGTELYIIVVGETIDGRIELESLTAEEAVLRDLGTNVEVHVPLTGT